MRYAAVFLALGVLAIVVIAAAMIGIGKQGLPADRPDPGGQRFDYVLLQDSGQMSEKNLTTITCIVAEEGPDKKRYSYLLGSAGTGQSEHSFVIMKTKDRTEVLVDSGFPVIPPIRPEIPNLQSFPEALSEPGASRTVDFSQSGTYAITNGTAYYQANGTSTFTGLGYRNLSTDSGTYECIGIAQTTTYTISEVLRIGFTDHPVEKTGRISGETWVDVHNGMVIRSAFDSHKALMVDLTSAGNNIAGFEKIYREVATDLHTETELTDAGVYGQDR